MKYQELAVTLSIIWILITQLPKLGYWFWWRKRILNDYKTVKAFNKLDESEREKWSFQFSNDYDKTIFRKIDLLVIISHFPGVLLANLIAPESKLGGWLMVIINVFIIWTILYLL